MLTMGVLPPKSTLFISLIFLSAISAETILPSPSGPFAVVQNTLKLTDESRVDPLDPNHGKRQLMISSFYPIQHSACEQTCTIPYVSRNAAPYLDDELERRGVPRGALSNIQLQACCKTHGRENKDASKVSLVFLLQGYAGTRILHSAQAQALASAGFAVITMDHTFESMAVEFPDGSVVPALNGTLEETPTPEKLASLQEIRVDDVRFVLSQLGDKDVAAKLVPGSPCGFNTSHTAVLGHSFGGSASINLLMKDSRFLGGMNLDGTQYGEITNVQQPAVLFGTADGSPFPHNSTSDPTWAEALEHLKGWKAEIGLKNVAHPVFMDAPLLYKAGALQLPEPVVEQLIGTLDGGRSFDIIITYVTAFLDFVLRGGRTTLFDGPSEEFPEIVVL